MKMKEIPLIQLRRALTGRRLLNAAKSVSAYVASALLHKPIVWGKPFLLTIEPTNLCNLRCPLCVTGNGAMSRATGFMDFPTFKRIIDEAQETLIYLLLYQQGEPFLHPEFVRFVEYAKQKRIFVTTSSNGHYFTPEMARQVVASGLDNLIVSIDGADQQNYATYRVGGDLAAVTAGIQHLIAEKERQKRRTPYIQIQFLVMRHNEHQIESMHQMAAKLKVDNLLVKTVQVETVEEAEAWLPRQASLRRYDLEQPGLKLKHAGRGVCSRPWTSTLINWDGTVSPCCFDKNGKHAQGSLQESLTTVWHSERYDHFRTTMLRRRDSIDICRNCTQGIRFYR